MATDSPVYNRLQSVFYRLPFMYDLWATATATDRNSGQPDRKSGCLRSIFRSGPVQFPVYMTGLSNTTCSLILKNFSLRWTWAMITTMTQRISELAMHRSRRIKLSLSALFELRLTGYGFSAHGLQAWLSSFLTGKLSSGIIGQLSWISSTLCQRILLSPYCSMCKSGTSTLRNLFTSMTGLNSICCSSRKCSPHLL